MNAADVLGDQPFDSSAKDDVAALLAHGNGQGVAILADGTLAALETEHTMAHDYCMYRLVPVQGEDR